MSVNEVNVSVQQRFYNKLEEAVKNKTDHFSFLTKSAYDNLLIEVEEAISASKRSSLQHRRVKRFNVVSIGDSKKLVARGDEVKYFIPMEDIYDVIDSAHTATGHGGRDRLRAETSLKYANITVEMINIYLDLCETCQKKKDLEKKDLFLNLFCTLTSTADVKLI